MLSSNTVCSARTGYYVQRVFYLVIFVIRENEIVICVIPDLLFFLFMNHARDPLHKPHIVLACSWNSEIILKYKIKDLKQVIISNQNNDAPLKCLVWISSKQSTVMDLLSSTCPWSQLFDDKIKSCVSIWNSDFCCGYCLR